jgi:hypothetical protein
MAIKLIDLGIDFPENRHSVSCYEIRSTAMNRHSALKPIIVI